MTTIEIKLALAALDVADRKGLQNLGIQLLEQPDLNPFGKEIFDFTDDELLKFVEIINGQQHQVRSLVEVRKIKNTRTEQETMVADKKQHENGKLAHAIATKPEKVKKALTKGIGAEHSKLLKFVIDNELKITDFQRLSKDDLKKAISTAMLGA